MYAGANAFSAKSYSNILGANDRVRVGVVGFSDRHRQSHLPCFMNHYKELNFDLVAVSDIWKIRREEGAALWKEKMGHDIVACRNNEEMYDKKLVDAVFIGTADFQHALHAIEAVSYTHLDVYKRQIPDLHQEKYSIKTWLVFLLYSGHRDTKL